MHLGIHQALLCQRDTEGFCKLIPGVQPLPIKGRACTPAAQCKQLPALSQQNSAQAELQTSPACTGTRVHGRHTAECMRLTSVCSFSSQTLSVAAQGTRQPRRQCEPTFVYVAASTAYSLQYCLILPRLGNWTQSCIDCFMDSGMLVNERADACHYCCFTGANDWANR